ncbi:MAG: hypothetical protein WAV38_14725, partial [Xanthobacteraceae bacterium]
MILLVEKSNISRSPVLGDRAALHLKPVMLEGGVGLGFDNLRCKHPARSRKRAGCLHSGAALLRASLAINPVNNVAYSPRQAAAIEFKRFGESTKHAQASNLDHAAADKPCG